MNSLNKMRFVVVAHLVFFLVLLASAGCGPAPRLAQNTQDVSASPPAVEAAMVLSSSATVNSPTPTVEETIEPTSSSLPDQSIYQGIPVGFTAEGYPYRGNPEAAVTIEEYSDYLCPFCGRHFSETLPALVENYISQGKLKYVFRDLPLVSLHPTAPVGHEAVLCVGDQGASLYWQMHDELFSSQAQWGGLPDPTGFVTDLAKKTGVDMQAFESCMSSGAKKEFVNQGVLAGQELGFNGTPSFQFIRTQTGDTYTLVGAYPLDTFVQWIDALVAGQAPPQAVQEEQESAELPYWANESGLAPDPARPGYTMAGDQYKGNPEAKVVVVEFSDFQCPACQQHALEIQPEIDKALVESGEIMWVFKHLPLEEHTQSLAAAAAAECAAEQGEFWEMHHLLFEKMDVWVIENPEPALVSLSKDLGLDTDVFSACLDSRQPVERVIQDLYASQGVASSTPTFIILSEGKGRMMQGSRDAEQFIKILENLLQPL